MLATYSRLTAPLIDLDGPAQTNTIQPQFTAIQPQYTAVPVPVPVPVPVQPQYTSYNPYLQQAQQEALQQEYARQQAEFARQQMDAQAALLHHHQRQEQQREQQQRGPLVPQPTAFGSNNPFAQPPHASPPPSPTIPERATTSPPRGRVPFTLTGPYDVGGRRPRATTARDDRGRDRDRERAPLRPYSTGAEPRRRAGGEGEDERLARVFAGYEGEGVDTFGNVGQLRCVFLLTLVCWVLWANMDECACANVNANVKVWGDGVWTARGAEDGGRGRREEPVLERAGEGEGEEACADEYQQGLD